MDQLPDKQSQPVPEPQDRDRRRHQRLELTLSARVLLPDGSEFACRVGDISPGGTLFLSAARPEIGAKIVAYIDEVGRAEGKVARHVPEGFAIRHVASPHRLERLAEILTYLANRDQLGMSDVRSHVRVRGKSKDVARVTFPDGRTELCRVIDMSLSGIAVATARRPEIGARVTVRRTPGWIVRHLADGVAIAYAEPVRIIDHFGDQGPES